jgi:hypothetical protein
VNKNKNESLKGFLGWNAIGVFAVPACVLTFMYIRIIITLRKSILVTKQMRNNRF